MDPTDPEQLREMALQAHGKQLSQKASEADPAKAHAHDDAAADAAASHAKAAAPSQPHESDAAQQLANAGADPLVSSPPAGVQQAEGITGDHAKLANDPPNGHRDSSNAVHGQADLVDRAAAAHVAVAAAAAAAADTTATTQHGHPIETAAPHVNGLVSDAPSDALPAAEAASASAMTRLDRGEQLPADEQPTTALNGEKEEVPAAAGETDQPDGVQTLGKRPDPGMPTLVGEGADDGAEDKEAHRSKRHKKEKKHKKKSKKEKRSHKSDSDA